MSAPRATRCSLRQASTAPPAAGLLLLISRRDGQCLPCSHALASPADLSWALAKPQQEADARTSATGKPESWEAGWGSERSSWEHRPLPRAGRPGPELGGSPGGCATADPQAPSLTAARPGSVPSADSPALATAPLPRPPWQAGAGLSAAPPGSPPWSSLGCRAGSSAQCFPRWLPGQQSLPLPRVLTRPSAMAASSFRSPERGFHGEPGPAAGILCPSVLLNPAGSWAPEVWCVVTLRKFPAPGWSELRDPTQEGVAGGIQHLLGSSPAGPWRPTRGRRPSPRLRGQAQHLQASPSQPPCFPALPVLPSLQCLQHRTQPQ